MIPADSMDIAAPAKINLYLEVLGSRPDGYHELDSVLLPLDLADRLVIETAPSRGIAVECPARSDLDGEANLVHRALTAFADTLGAGAPGFHVVLEKRVPVAAGLGGGSSDAAAALKAASTLTGSPLGWEAMLELASDIGADLPFFMGSGPAWIRGKGEILESPCAICRICRSSSWCLKCRCPRQGCSTCTTSFIQRR